MKVVALVSGGKDSCFAMMRCIDFGHEVVALANLIPLDDSVDELDSYMYQTAGHQIIVSYAHCMGLPLFRRRIHGTSREVGADYRATKGDEVEDMYALLHEVKRRLPCVNAVCSGAIASDYQRVRVESVCSRLGLVSFAFLWKQDQTLLLEEMIRRGIVAITVKVAAMGLNPSEHLGKELSYLKPKLFALKEKFGINVCGEGGEYESLTLDCPLFHNARIILDKYDVLLQSEDSVIAPVGVLHPSAFHLEQKHGSSGTDRASDVYQVDDNPVPNSQSQPLNSESDTNVNLRISSTETTKTFSIGCWILSTSNGLKEDLTTILKQIESQLNSNGLDWVNVLYVHLYISNMKLFAMANEVYVNHITSSKCRFGVPSRSTIELPLTQSQLGNAYVEVMVAKEPNLKKVLHVQSISCWAPSCIGPYSQATKYMKVLYMAGQLGLDPPTMELCQGGPSFELEQALRNSEAIAQCFNSSIFSSTFLFVIYCSAQLTSSEKTLIQDKFEIFSRGPAFLYILAPDLPKGASVEVKPVLYIRDTEEENEEREIEMKELQVSKSEMQLDESCFKIRNMNNGKICSAIVSVTKNMALKICSQEDKCDFEYVSNEELKSIAKFCASLVSRILKENSFSWDDLVSSRFYYGTKLSSSGINMADIFSVAFSELAQVDGSVKIYEEPFFNLVPVLGSGQSASMDDIITCELFASKL